MHMHVFCCIWAWMNTCAQRSVLILEHPGASCRNPSSALWLSMDQQSNWLITTQANWLLCFFFFFSHSLIPFSPNTNTKTPGSRALCPPIPLPFLTLTFASLSKHLCPSFAFVSPLFPSACLSFFSGHLSMCRLSQAWVRVKQLSTNRTNEVRPRIPLTGISSSGLWSLSAFNDQMKHSDTRYKKTGTLICGNTQPRSPLCRSTNIYACAPYADTYSTRTQTHAFPLLSFMTRCWLTVKHGNKGIHSRVMCMDEKNKNKSKRSRGGYWLLVCARRWKEIT